MLSQQDRLPLSGYSDLYDKVVPKGHLLRRLNDLCGNFDFIYDELKGKYCPDNGRMASDPRMLFKYLILKVVYDLSDVDVVAHSRYDMSYKYFLGLSPEEDVIAPSTLCKFRRQRLKDDGLLDSLLGRSVSIALENNLITSKDIIVDSTHTRSRSNPQAPLEALRRRGRELRKAVYGHDANAEAGMPGKYEGGDLQEEMSYAEELARHVSGLPVSSMPAVSERLNVLKETVEDVRARYDVSKDGDARTGHKTGDSSYFGYKTHIAMSEEGIITSAVVTSGEKDDGKQMQALIDKSVANGVEVETVIGDGAYCSKENVAASKGKGISVESKVNPLVQGIRSDSRFSVNKDAMMAVCPAGHMSIRKHSSRDGKRDTYYFDVRKCIVCGLRDGCFKYGQGRKTLSVCHRTDGQKEQMAFQKTEEFRRKYGTRYKIEAKNSDLKHNYGYDRADSYGLHAMTLQGAVAMFACNMRRIVRLLDAERK